MPCASGLISGVAFSAVKEVVEFASAGAGCTIQNCTGTISRLASNDATSGTVTLTRSGNVLATDLNGGSQGFVRSISTGCTFAMTETGDQITVSGVPTTLTTGRNVDWVANGSVARSGSVYGPTYGAVMDLGFNYNLGGTVP